jgi:hypothetical protein
LAVLSEGDGSSISVVVRQLVLTAVKVSVTVGRQLLRVLGRWYTLKEDRVVVAGQVHDVLVFTVGLVLSGQPGMGPVFIGLVGGGGEGVRGVLGCRSFKRFIPPLSHGDVYQKGTLVYTTSLQLIIQSLISLGL